MTATLWLLAGLASVALIALLAVWARRRWGDAAQALEYRTAYWSAIQSDTRKLQAQVPNAPPRPRKRAGPIER